MSSPIMVPLDGSTLAERALPCAMMLARALATDVILLRAVSLPPDVQEVLTDAEIEADAAIKRLEMEAGAYMREIALKLEETGVNIQTIVLRKPAAEAIVDYADEMDVQQIVLATHGHSGLGRWRHGSVAERVLQSARAPVLMVCAGGTKAKDTVDGMSCRRILVPLDGSALAERALPPIIPIARALQAEVVLLRVPIAHISGSLTGNWFVPLEGTLRTADQIARTYLEDVADGLRENGIDVTTATRSGSVANVIVEFAASNQIDLIAMCTHGRAGLARWTLGSVADRVLRAGCLPLLLVRAQ